MLKMTTVAVLLAYGCGGEDVPSCQQAMTHYYGAACVYRDATSGEDIPSSEMILTCRQILAEIPDACQSEMDDWLICNGSVAGQTDEGCDCSAELDTLVICAR